jgi:hypothetical protein
MAIIHRSYGGAGFLDATVAGDVVLCKGSKVYAAHRDDAPGVLVDLVAPVQMLYPRIRRDGLAIAAKSHTPGTVYTWFGGGWVNLGVDSPGEQGHGWHPDGHLTTLTGAPHQESQGLRFYNPALAALPGANTDITGGTPGWVTGTPTAGPSGAVARALGLTRLHNFYAWPDGIAVGQGDAGGLVLQHPALGHRVLLMGDAKFVTAQREGERFVVTVARAAQGDGWVFWFNELDIPSIPVYPAGPIVVEPPPVEPPPPPPPPPDPDPEEPPVSWNTAPELAARRTAEAVRQQFPEEWAAAHVPHGEDRRYVTRVASYLKYGWAAIDLVGNPNWGLNGKRGTDVLSEDILNYVNPAVPKLGLESYDFFRATMPEAGIVWNNITDPDGAGAKYIEPPHPSALPGGAAPPPPPPPPPPHPPRGTPTTPTTTPTPSRRRPEGPQGERRRADRRLRLGGGNARE